MKFGDIEDNCNWLRGKQWNENFFQNKLIELCGPQNIQKKL